jgi:HD-GYP domain-containing protein (c-di-GMP phosphodiesterase class II)
MLIFSDSGLLKTVEENLHKHYGAMATITVFRSVLEALDHLELKKKQYSLIVFEFTGKSLVVVRGLIELGGSAGFVYCGNQEDAIKSLKDTEIPIEFLPLDRVASDLVQTVQKMEVTGRIPMLNNAGSSYVQVRLDFLPSMGPLEAIVYAQSIDGRFIPIFNKGEAVTQSDVEKHRKDERFAHYYFKRDEMAPVLNQQNANIDAAMKEHPIDPVKAEAVLSNAQNVVRDVVRTMGFTPEAQKVAVNSVSAAIRMMGSKPKLAGILTELKSKEGQYLTLHSLMLGKVCCALAYQIGWSSNTTYFKLSLAAFLHDLSLDDDRLAKVTSLDQATKSEDFSADEIKEVRFHSIKGSEYARGLSEVPSDVELIVAHHHEQPDGTGFPRGMNAKLFTPLSALFLIAQDLMDYTEQFQKKHDISLDSFCEAREMKYSQGVFKKIIQALKTHSTIQ